MQGFRLVLSSELTREARRLDAGDSEALLHAAFPALETPTLHSDLSHTVGNGPFHPLLPPFSQPVKKAGIHGFTISCQAPDNIVYLKDGSLCMVRSVYTTKMQDTMTSHLIVQRIRTNSLFDTIDRLIVDVIKDRSSLAFLEKARNFCDQIFRTTRFRTLDHPHTVPISSCYSNVACTLIPSSNSYLLTVCNFGISRE